MLSHGALAGIIIAVIIAVGLAVAIPLIIKSKNDSENETKGSLEPVPTGPPAELRKFHEIFWVPGPGSGFHSYNFSWNMDGITCDVANCVVTVGCPYNSSLTGTGCSEHCGKYVGQSPVDQWNSFKTVMESKSGSLRLWIQFRYATGWYTPKPESEQDPQSFEEQYNDFSKCYPTLRDLISGIMFTTESSQLQSLPDKELSPTPPQKETNTFEYLSKNAAAGKLTAIIGTPWYVTHDNQKKLNMNYGFGEFYEPEYAQNDNLPSLAPCCNEPATLCPDPAPQYKTCGGKRFGEGINYTITKYQQKWSEGLYKDVTNGGGVLFVGGECTGTDCGINHDQLPQFVEELDGNVKRLGLWL